MHNLEISFTEGEYNLYIEKLNLEREKSLAGTIANINEIILLNVLQKRKEGRKW